MAIMQRTYRFTVLATDIATFALEDGALKVLLIQMKKSPFTGMWALPGGLVQPKEELEVAARRHLREKTGVRHTYAEQLATFGKVDRDPFGRVVSVAYLALLSSPAPVQTMPAYHAIAWHSAAKLPRLAYDHKEIIASALERLKAKVTYTNIVCHLLPKEFRMAELQTAYELILNRALDKRNFQKKILSLGLVQKTSKLERGEAHRPAALFTFRSQQPALVDIL